MTDLAQLLRERDIRSALIVDDVFDSIPTAADIGPTHEGWSIFSDDLTREQREQIENSYPPAASTRFDELIANDEYVATVWRLRDDLGAIATNVFATYIADQASDQNYVSLAREKLEALGLACDTAGREFIEKAQRADVILIDLFFGNAQDSDALDASKNRLRQAIEPRGGDPPLVILMSRSARLGAKRDEFRNEVGLLDSAFRIIKKSDLEENNLLETQLERLAKNADDSRKLARFFHELNEGLTAAAERTLVLLRNLKLSDVGQIQQLLLSAEGEPAGSYLVDIFDRVLQHEIEREVGIIDAALRLNEFSSAAHPPPYVAGSVDLQQLVQRLLTQNENRLRLPGSVGAVVSFGDVLRMPHEANEEQLKRALLVDLTPENVLLVLTPACDLQRGGAPRILLLVGSLRPLQIKDWSYGGDARTPAILIDGHLHWVKWNLKHVDTVTQSVLVTALNSGEIRIVTRLRESHALELQQRVLAGLGRIGLVASLPATFSVDVEAYYPNRDGCPVRIDVPGLEEEGAVCFVGRDNAGKQAIRLVFTEGTGDGLHAALNDLHEEEVAPDARRAFRHVTSTPDLRRLLESGVDIGSAKANGWISIPSETGAASGIPKMGLLARNYQIVDEPLGRGDLSKAGVMLVVRDMDQPDEPGLDPATRRRLVEAISRAPEAEGPAPS